MTYTEKQIEFDARNTQYWETAKQREAALYQETEALFKKVFPKRKKFDFSKIKDLPEYTELFERHKASAQILIDAHTAYKDEAEQILNKFALAESVPVLDVMECRYVCYSSTYNSQGFGASKYAQNSAQMKADLASFHGLNAEVRPVGEVHRFNGITYENYGVFVNTSEIGWKMLMRKPGPGLKETIRLSWKRGCNPRVYNPWLPYGIEEKLGLDYFGNEVSKLS